jgi:hypothetical protein
MPLVGFVPNCCSLFESIFVKFTTIWIFVIRPQSLSPKKPHHLYLVIRQVWDGTNGGQVPQHDVDVCSENMRPQFGNDISL